MQKFLKTILSMALCAIAFNVYALDAAQPDAEKAVDQTIAEFMKKNNVPGVAVAVYVNGKPHTYYYGVANKDKKTPITKDTIFEVGSISKLMTSILVAQEVDFAKMDLHASVKKYVPYLSASFDDVTLQDLATHTAGLPFNVSSTLKTQPELEKYLTAASPQQEPGEYWGYSNMGIGLLGFAVENETHKNFNELYLTRIANPLGMQKIGLVVPAKLKKNYAQGYDKNDQAVAPLDRGLFPAAGGLKASASDMQRFLGAAIGVPGTSERILYPIRLTQSSFVKLPKFSQGLGWQIHELNSSGDIRQLMNDPDQMNFGPIAVDEILDQPLYNGNALMDKTGATDGFRAYIAVIPNRQSGIVILTNKYVSNGAIVDTGRDILFKLTKLTQA